MNRTVLCGVMLLFRLCEVDMTHAADSVPTETRGAPRITVAVDPRVELMSVIFRLAGNPEYNQGKVQSYVRDVDSHFGPFRDHPVVRLARKLRETQGVSFDAVMCMAVHVTDAVTLQERIPFSPQPRSLDSRWTPETAREFLDLARRFVAETKFNEFLEQHEPLYAIGVRRMQELLDQHAHLEWFDSFFGPRKDTEFRLVLGMLNGGGSYGVHYRNLNGQEEMYSIVGVWSTNLLGQPRFPPDVVPTIIHEFTHSYTNPLVDRFAAELQGPGEVIERYVRDEMRRQAYSGWKTLMYESLNRACGLRYVLATEGPAAMQKAIEYEKSRSFFWVGELAEVLGEYDRQPREYEDLVQFFPRIIAFFDDYAKNADAKLGAIQAGKDKQVQEWRQKGPQIVGMIPPNGAEDVDPNLQAIIVTFDRPMRSPGWAVVTLGSPSEVPQSTGPVGYDAQRRVFTMPVELEAGKEYRFGLNAEGYLGFCSEEGVPLAPVVVRFKTQGAGR
ncbi:MAG: DUF4932 domain-containing protein [Phycisphaerae bacterium]|nr:DUF4932 domain-containing protein [Phycisphaerae bacterium]